MQSKQAEIGVAYTHPMADIRNAADLTAFVEGYKKGKPPVSTLRPPKNPFWDRIQRLGALPRSKLACANVMRQKANLSTPKDISNLLEGFIDNGSGDAGMPFSKGFWILPEGVFAAGWCEGLAVMGILFNRQSLGQLEIGQYSGEHILPLSFDEMDERVKKFNQLDMLGVMEVPFDVARAFPEKDIAAKGCAFKTAALLQFCRDTQKYGDIFGDRWINAVRVGDGFYDASLLLKLMDVLSQLDDECQIYVSATPELNERERTPLFILSKSAKAALMPIKFRNWDKMDDQRTHHVLVAGVPDVASDSLRFKLHNANTQIKAISTSLESKASQLDSDIRMLLTGQNEIERLLSSLMAIHDVLDEGVSPSLDLSGYERNLQNQFIELVTGSKFKTECLVNGTLTETAIQSENLLEKIRQWVKDGQSLLAESQAHINEFRPVFKSTDS